MSSLSNPGCRCVAVKVSLSVDLLQELDRLAETLGLSRSELIRQAIERTLEDADDIAVSEARMADANDGVVPWAQVKAEPETPSA